MVLWRLDGATMRFVPIVSAGLPLLFFWFLKRRPQTIAGGSGAGPTWHGTSGVHTHITNTRIGDVEILERRYPVIIRTFGLREGSAGKGEYDGGDGTIRDLEFTQRLQVSILS